MSFYRRFIVILLLSLITLFSLLTSNHVFNHRSHGNKLFRSEEVKRSNKPSKIAYLKSAIKKVNLPHRLFHLDLKGGSPKLSYLHRLLPLLLESGCTGLLIEYEDMFPFSGKLVNISHGNAYGKIELRNFLQTAAKIGLDIIPLIQTFGHLELLLKYKENIQLRENPKFPQEICPNNKIAVKTVTDIIDQVFDFHVDSSLNLEFVHIGCDEVFHIGECNICNKLDAKDIFVSHVKWIASYIRSKYNLRAIIWDDMLRKFYGDELKKSQLGDFVELMVWDYTENVDHLVPPYLWPVYTETFTNIWAASAFKGAFGETLFQVQIQRHFSNQRNWLQVLDREVNGIVNLRGIALTGWSRYDHFSVLCELLPVSIPSLLGCLQIVSGLSINSNCSDELSSCSWEGSDLYKEMIELKYLKESVEELVKEWTINKGWFTEYNYKFNETSVWRLEEPKINAERLIINLNKFKIRISVLMREYFEEFVVTEWIMQNVHPLCEIIHSFSAKINILSEVTEFKRRPLF